MSCTIKFLINDTWKSTLSIQEIPGAKNNPKMESPVRKHQGVKCARKEIQSTSGLEHLNLQRKGPFMFHYFESLYQNFI